MNRIWKNMTRLMSGILVLLLLITLAPASVFAEPERSYTEGEISAFEVVVPVEIENVQDSKAKIEQLEGPRTILPSATTITPDAQGKGKFKMSFAGSNNGDVFKYRITEVNGTKKNVTYNVTDKTYICEVWIFNNEETGQTYARAFLYESKVPLQLVDEHGVEDESIPKPDKCLFKNQTHNDPPTATNATSLGRKGDTQTSDRNKASDGSKDTVRNSGKVSFKKGSGELTTISLYDPEKDEYVDFPDGKDELVVPAYDENGKKIGTYKLTKAERDKLLKGEEGQVEFIPDPDFVGTPKPAQIRATDEFGYTATSTYTPTVVGPPTPSDAESWGDQGKPQASDGSGDTKDNEGEISFTPGDGKLKKLRVRSRETDKYIEFTDDIDMDSIELPAYDENGKQIGTYTLTKKERDKILLGKPGKVQFHPDPDFVGDPQPFEVQVEDEYGYVQSAFYQPHVEGTIEPPKATGDKTEGWKGEPQTGEVTFTEGSSKIVKVELIDPHTGKPAKPNADGTYTVDALDKDGNVVGKYVLDPKTKKTNADGTISYDVVFTPDPDFVGTPLPATIRATDENGLTADALYQPHVKDKNIEPPAATGDETEGWKGEKQTGKVTFTEGSGKIVKVELIDPHTGKPAKPNADGTYTVDALDKDGNVVGKYVLDPSTKKVNADGSISYDVVFIPDPDFVGTPLPATVRATDENGLTADALYQPLVKDRGATPTKPAVTSVPRVTRAATEGKITTPKTGDSFQALPYVIGIAAALAVLFALIGIRRKRRSDDYKE